MKALVGYDKGNPLKACKRRSGMGLFMSLLSGM